jgi:hypothetical protein
MHLIYKNTGSSGSVQLRGGVVPQAGTVEYCIGGTWRAVCHNNWDDKDAFVVCRQLGFPATGTYVHIMNCMHYNYTYLYRCCSISKLILWNPSFSKEHLFQLLWK